MRPAIYYTGGNRDQATLVDRDSVRVTTRPDGKSASHFAAAVFIADLSAGEIHFEMDLIEKRPGDISMEKSKIIAPRPCVYAVNREPAELGLANRRIDQRAAIVLLQLARSANAMIEDTGREVWKFGDPIERGGKLNWDPFRFIAAWTWSHWQANRIPGKAQWEEMKRHGYPHSAGTLRKMLADIGLVTANRRQQ